MSMKRCKCNPSLGEECDVCNPPPSEIESIAQDLHIEQAFRPVEGHTAPPYNGPSAGLRRLLALADKGKAQRKGAATQPRGKKIKALDREGIIRAANKRAKDCWPDSDPAMRGWKGVVAHELNTEWRTLKDHLHRFDLTEGELIDRMREWRPPNP